MTAARRGGAARILATFVMARYVRRWRSRAALERHQRRRLRRQLRFLAARSPHLAGAAAEASAVLATRGRSGSTQDALSAALACLPLMDKAAMMDSFDALVTVPVTRDAAMDLAMEQERSRRFDGMLAGCSVGLSSGTSGRRGLFVVSPREREAWVGTVMALALPRDRPVRGHRIALFLRADNSLYEAVRARSIAFRFFDTFAPLAPQVADLAAFAPTVLVGPASVLAELARLGAAEGVELRPGRVVSVAEVLDAGQRERIAAGFGVGVVHQLYQCTEGLLGHTCELGTLHLNEQLAIIERERERAGAGRFVPIVTDLYRRAQPIVRYRLGDVLVERAEPCPCGSALTAIDVIEGREGDALTAVTPAGEERVIVADVVMRAMTYAQGFDDYRVVQVAPGRLRVELDSPSDEAGRSAVAELTALFAAQGCQPPRIDIAPFRPDFTRKLRRVIREDVQ